MSLPEPHLPTSRAQPRLPDACQRLPRLPERLPSAPARARLPDACPSACRQVNLPSRGGEEGRTTAGRPESCVDGGRGRGTTGGSRRLGPCGLGPGALEQGQWQGLTAAAEGGEEGRQPETFTGFGQGFLGSLTQAIPRIPFV